MTTPLPVDRVGRPAPAELLALRQRLADAFAAGQSGERLTIAGIPVLCFGDFDAQTVVVHFHGGGYRQGQPEMLARYASELAERARVAVWCPAYRLAPEHPFPAALMDGMTLLNALSERDGARIVLAGDSAGGGLAAALVQLCNRKGIAVSGLLLHSPWLDLRVTNECYRRHATSDPLFSEQAAVAAAESYLQGHSALDPLSSPIVGELSRFPPTFVSVGTGEVLYGDAAELHQRMSEAGCEIAFCEIDGMEHTAVVRDFQLTGSSQVFRATLKFLKRVG